MWIIVKNEEGNLTNIQRRFYIIFIHLFVNLSTYSYFDLFLPVELHIQKYHYVFQLNGRKVFLFFSFLSSFLKNKQTKKLFRFFASFPLVSLYFLFHISFPWLSVPPLCSLRQRKGNTKQNIKENLKQRKGNTKQKKNKKEVDKL